MGSGQNGQWTFIDILSILSFMLGLMNLDENVTQGDKQDLMQELSNKADVLLKEIHGHLATQDAKIDQILEVLYESNQETG